jgi:hypothetical protein
MCSGMGDTTQLVPGFPIRTPWDHSSVDSSPRPIAASHVLHRLLVPRHPPYALSNLTTKMLASTVQFSTNATQPTHTHQHPHHRRVDHHSRVVCRPGQRPVLARKPNHQTSSPSYRRDDPPWLFSQDPTGCLPRHPPAAPRPDLPTPGGQHPHGRYYRNRAVAGHVTLPVSPPSSTPPPHTDLAPGDAGPWTAFTARRS